MITAIILAAGKSTRFVKPNGKKSIDKLLMPILGRPLIYYTIQSLHDHPKIHQLYVVVSLSNQKILQKIVKKYHFPKVKKIILGSNKRQNSVQKGFQAIKMPAQKDLVIIHNGANPLVTEKEISLLIDAAKAYKAAAVGKNMVDTIKEIKSKHYIKTHEREKLRAMQTPQVIQYNILKKALNKARAQKKTFNDETSLVENIGIKPRHIDASTNNFKVTTWKDYELVKLLLGDTPQNFLVGLGQDSHKFSSVQKGLTLGGIFLKDEPKLEANSDGDVIIHALCNAISQALGQGSLGLFATPLFKEKNITSSHEYLKKILKKITTENYHLNNIGLMIEAKHPQIDQLAASIKKSLSRLTGLSIEKIGITATTGEGMTPFGKGEGIQCFAIVSLIQ